MTASDADLISQIIMGDHDAFARLVNKYQSSTRALLRRLTGGDYSLADDLAQETFFKVHLRISQFRCGSNFTTWLYRIAYNEFLQFCRKEKRKREGIALGNEIDWEEAKDPAASIDLDKALKHLKANERTVITLNFTLGMSLSEISKVTDMPIGTVNSHFGRGKQKLAHYLSAWKNNSDDNQ